MAKSNSSWSKLLNTLQIRNDYSEVPAGLRWRTNTFFILASVAIGLFSDMFLYGLIVPVLPFMLNDRIGVPESEIQSHVSALLAVYAGASMVFSPIAGVMADRMATRQAPFVLGLLALIGATSLLFVGKTLPVLYLARILQGISAGFVWTIGIAICLETVGADKFGTTMGMVFSIGGAGNIVSPLLGGVLYEKAGYEGVFGLGCGILVVDLLMRLLVIEKSIGEEYEAKNPGALSGGNITDANGQSNDAAESQPPNPSDGENQPLLGQRNDDELAKYKFPDNLPAITRTIPLFPCLTDPQLFSTFIVGLVSAILFGSIDSTIPLVAKELFGFNSLKSGILFLPPAVLDLFLGPLFGWIVDRYGTKPVSVAGFAFLVPVHVLLRLPRAGGTDQVVLYGGLLGLIGVGMSAIGPLSVTESGKVVKKYQDANPGFFGAKGPYAQLYGLTNLVFNLGLTIGPELAGGLKDAIGYGNMNIVLAALCGCTSLLCLKYIGGPLKLRRERSEA